MTGRGIGFNGSMTWQMASVFLALCLKSRADSQCNASYISCPRSLYVIIGATAGREIDSLIVSVSLCKVSAFCVRALQWPITFNLKSIWIFETEYFTTCTHITSGSVCKLKHAMDSAVLCILLEDEAWHRRAISDCLYRRVIFCSRISTSIVCRILAWGIAASPLICPHSNN